MTIDKEKKLIFLFGAGSSIEAGVSSSDSITEVLINYGKYCSSKNSTEIENLLKYIQVRIADYLQIRAAEVNFEYILGTLLELSQREDDSIVAFLGDGDQLIKKLEANISLNEVIDKLYSLLREQFFLRYSVEYLHPLKKFLKISSPLDLFTLNYDLSLETAFEELDTSFTTGFKKKNQDSFPIWSPSEFEKDKFKARIFKLHGSINWGHYFSFSPPPQEDACTINVSDAARNYIYNYPSRIQFSPFPIRPIEPPDRSAGMVGIMNFGTRKELFYASTQFTIMFHYFLEALQKARTCVIAGYSFRDERINKILEEAMIERRGKLRFIIVDPNIYRIMDKNPVFHEFKNLGWIQRIDKQVGDALNDSSIVDTIDDVHNKKPLSNSGYSKTKEELSKIEKVLKQWKTLGNTFDLVCFWMVFLDPQIKKKKFMNCDNKEDAIELGKLLMPLNRKVRDLCWHIRWLYDAMELCGRYSEEELNSIQVEPKLMNDFSHINLIEEWLPKLGMAFSYAYNAYNGCVEEFKHVITDPEVAKKLEAPDSYSAAELIISHDINRTYELVDIINDIYKGAGYEEPFELIAKKESSS